MRKRTDTCGARASVKHRRRNHPAAFIALVAITAMTWAAIRTATLRVVIIGDSTAYTYTAADSLRGWGQELGFFFNKGAVTVINKSIGGRSSRSFVEDGHWASTKAILQKGDILLISFGTNDRGTVAERHADTAQFRQFLTQYVTESRAMGVIPVLISTVNQNSWSGTTFTEGFNTGVNDYHGAMLRVVNALKVPFIDLEQKTATLFKTLGQTYLANFIFIAGNTHFQEMGAVTIAKLVAEGIKELDADPDIGKLAAVVAPQYMVSVIANKTGAGILTVSGTYPQSAPLTLAVLPNSGQTFQGWADAGGKSLSTKTSYLFTMGSAACTYRANFLGGTSVTQNIQAASVTNSPIAISPETSAKTLTITSAGQIRSVHVFDPVGRLLRAVQPNSRYAVVDVHTFTTGVYFAAVTTSDGRYSSSILVR